MPVPDYRPARDPTGQIILYYEGHDSRRIVIDLLTCIHCGGDFPKQRHGRHGFCLKCFNHTCGRVECDKCTGPNPIVKRTGKL